MTKGCPKCGYKKPPPTIEISCGSCRENSIRVEKKEYVENQTYYCKPCLQKFPNKIHDYIQTLKTKIEKIEYIAKRLGVYNDEEDSWWENIFREDSPSYENYNNPDGWCPGNEIPITRKELNMYGIDNWDNDRLCIPINIVRLILEGKL